ncbi:MAG: multiheme c-type cytochrome [Terracidiphilus sp.]
MKRWLKIASLVVVAVALLAVGLSWGATYYYTSQKGQGCASCHEMAALTGSVHASMHRTVGCMECHEASMATKLRHIRVHLFGRIPEAIRLREADVLAMEPRCQSCHQKEYASWHAGPHAATYAEIFADPTHNRKRQLMDDCLRCHGMHFGGPVRELVGPIDTKGPWRILPAGMADRPAMPCQACHQVHREGAPESRPKGRISVAGKPVDDSLAFFDRREQMHLTAASMRVPRIFDGARALAMSQDPRQSLCYQCHAPREPETGSEAAKNGWGVQAGSGDDRTPMGVHEGISCAACHFGHNESAVASCKTCHPKMSNCGLDVEKMDTTFANQKSPHNIHWVKCADCHTHGVPKKKDAQAGAAPKRPLAAGD